MKYKDFGNVDIPADFEMVIRNTRSYVEVMHDDKLLTDSEYNVITTIIDGAEYRKYDQMKALHNDQRNHT